jgi:two-component system, cell cycle sensor histidine kinase and response regulator CckA
VRNLLQNILNSAGYQVLTASDGKKALEIADQHKRNIDLLLSDIVMPEMTGLELAKTLRSKHPEIRIMLTSAYPQGMTVMDSGWRFLPKPFLPRRLLEEVAQVLSFPAEFKPEEHQ